MTLMQILIWIVIGGVAGVIADALIRGIKLGLIGSILVGIAGAFVGSWLFGLLNINIGLGIFGDILTAAVGAVILLVILRA
ncbi:MAG: hypothetical protein A2Z16_00005, partial [Chloroflexi bacterium RBG_16_54_18]